MKRCISPLSIIVCCLCTCLPLQARTVEVKVSELNSSESIAKQITNIAKSLRLSDSIIIDFDQPGTFAIDREVVTNCNTEIKGLGTSKTILEIHDGKDTKGNSLLKDDNIFGFKGSRTSSCVSVNIHDLSIKLGNESGTWWDGKERFLIKCIQAQPVVIRNVDTYLHDQKITNVDLRTCSDVTIEDCYFENYNNGPTGGCLWVRGPVSNMTIKNNVFRKHGNDEVLAIYEANLYRGTINKENINVTNNEFYYVKPNNKIKDVINEAFITLFTVQEKKEKYVHRHVHFDNNKIEISAPMKTIMSFNFEAQTTLEDVTFSNNSITNHSGAGLEASEKTDIVVRDINDGNVVTISNNQIKGECKATYEKGGSDSHFCLLVKGGKAEFLNNMVTDKYGTTLIYGYEPGGTAILRDNKCSGLSMLAKVAGGEDIKQFTLIAENNIFSGSPRIYSANLERCDYQLRNNTINSTNYHFFLQEMAAQGSVVFEGNTVNCTDKNGGIIYASYDNQPHRFTKVSIKNNVFKGIGGEDRVKGKFPNASNISITGNRYNQ